MTKKLIDINCDLGEGSTEQDCHQDAKLMKYLSRCNIACGGHAGNELTMRLSMINAAKHKVKVGAHPGYPDRENFGRKSLVLSAAELRETVDKQLIAFHTIANALQMPVAHIKFHGALYNDLEKSVELAELMADFLASKYPELAVVALSGGVFYHACKVKGLSVMAEGFIDRRYLANGQLTPRTLDGAVIDDIDESLEQAKSLALGQAIDSHEQQPITLVVDTLCLHGDNPQAEHIANQLVDYLARFDIEIA